MNGNNTWIKLPRNFQNWRWYKESNMVHLYLYLVMNANLLSENYFDINIKRGEIMISLSRLSTDTNLSIKTLRTCLDRLKRTHEIEYRNLNHGRIIIIVNYDMFQPIGIDETAPDWVKLYRKIEQWRWYTHPKMVHLLIHFLIKAKAILSGNDFTFQLETSYNLLSKETGISVQSVRTCIKKMQSSGVIEFLPSPTNLFSTIRVCNYENYQVTNKVRGVIDNHSYGNKGTIPGELDVDFENSKKSTNLNISTSHCPPTSYESTKTSKGTTRAREGHDKGTIPGELDVDFENSKKSTNLNISTSHCPPTSYESTKTSKGTTRAREGHDKGTTRARQGHDKGTTRATLKEYNNIRNKEIKNINYDDAREGVVFVEAEEVKDEQKENLQKKAGKETYKEKLLEDGVWMTAMGKKFHLDQGEIKRLLDDFDLELICRGNNEDKGFKDYKCHFFDWLKLRSNTLRTISSSTQAKGERWEGEMFVPKSSEGGIYNGPF